MAEQNEKTTEKKEAFALRGKASGLIIQRSGKGIRISVYNTKGKKEKKIEDLEITRDQWLQISTTV